jgi:replicative DNA helicase
MFRTALMLHGQGKPTDLTSMTAWLADTGSLEKVGGNGRLIELVERVSSTASIEQVARLVMDKFLRRQLIRSGNEVIKLGFDQSLPMEQVLDQAEQTIFAISQKSPPKGLHPQQKSSPKPSKKSKAAPWAPRWPASGELLRPGCDDPGPAAQRPDHRGRTAGDG